jgi:HEAT repeat protein
MKRVVLLGVLMIVPALAAAQVPPPAPPPPPATPVAPAPRPAPAPMAIPPTPPAVMVVPPMLDQWVIEDSVRNAVQIAHDAARWADEDAMRAAEEQARVAGEKAREDSELIRERLREAMPPMRLDMQDRPFAVMSGQDSESSSYSAGLSLLQNRQYDQAINRFDRAIAAKGSHADGAWYWKAFAQYKLGKSEDALASIATLRKDFPQSRYLTDAKVLEADVRKPSIDRIDDDEIKLLAIQGIQNSDPAKAAQLAATLLSGTNSLRVKRQALYILALSDQPSAHELLLSYAKGNGNPDLQREAINYLATRRTKQPTTSSELKQIYEATNDPSIRRAIIDAYRLTGDKASLLSVASAGGTPVEIRSQAIRNLSDVAAPTDLWALYQKEEDKDLRIAMVRSFSSMGAVEQLLQIAKSDKDPSVRQQAIRSLGSQKIDKTGTTLVDMYGTETDKDAKMAIISALANQNNDTGLVALARKETKDVELKRQLVTKIAEMSGRSKVAQDYLLEVIK